MIPNYEFVFVFVVSPLEGKIPLSFPLSFGWRPLYICSNNPDKKVFCRQSFGDRVVFVMRNVGFPDIFCHIFRDTICRSTFPSACNQRL